MKRILGLDLGSSSIGWAVVDLDSDKRSIVNMGSRIIPLTTDDEKQFTKGQAITKNADRTSMRTARKGYDRYQMRRANLKAILEDAGIVPVDIVKPIDLWMLRSKAVSERIELSELGRVLLHINQKRGYKSGKEDFNDSSKSKYVQSVNENYRYLVDNNMTLGQYFYGELLKDGAFRIKDRVYPRIAYISEFDAIIAKQREFYPDVLTDAFLKKVKDETIFYQRKLKSCKHLVSVCEFEKKEYVKADGTSIVTGPKVAPKSSPVAQLCKVWEFVNTITITNKMGDQLYLSPEQKMVIADYLKRNVRIKVTELQKILGISKKDGWWIDKTISQRNVGDTTYVRISEALGGKYPELLRMEVVIDDLPDTSTGEVRLAVSESIKTEPLFRLWHTMYSISDEDELRRVLNRKFGITDDDVLTNLSRIDFVKDAYSGKSNTAMRKILPYLMKGYVYSDACALAGYNHSNSITKEENLKRELKTRLDPIMKGEMRQPIVEKILNQTVNVVNALIDQYGAFDEIRVELARELKQSREEREKATKRISRNEKENKVAAEKVAEYGFTPTRNRILKMKLWEETQHLCIYCGQPVGATEFLSGIDVEKEHIIPRSLLFDNSSSNVTCACRACNQEKGNRTAYDFMKSKGDSAFADYASRVTALFDGNRINKPKYNKLMMSQESIPTGFIERQMRETQYVSKKAMEMLRDICSNVYATSGSVTDFLRHTWGWDEILHDLHFDQYKKAGLTEVKEIASNGNVKTVERIKGWTKRIDHRHHAIDALTIACTSQGIIQQLSTLNTLKDVPNSGLESQDAEFKERHTRLEKYVLSQPHFSTGEVKEAVEKILVSFKSGKKVATPGKRYVYQGGKRVLMQNTLVPRGALSEQTVYGKISLDGKEEIVVKQAVSSLDAKKADKIVDKAIQKIILDYLETHKGKFVENDPPRDHQGNIIRSVRVVTGSKSAVPVRYDSSGIPLGYVEPGNNHHVAFYRDNKGKIQESVVTFWHAVDRKKYGIPVVIDNPAKCHEMLPDTLPEPFLAQLPDPTWEFVMSLQSNEMYALGMTEESYQDAVACGNYAELSKHLYRVQKLTSKCYVFRHHLETTVDDKIDGEKNELLSMSLGKFIRIRSADGLLKLSPVKMKITNTGTVAND